MKKDNFSFTELFCKKNSENVIFYTILTAIFFYFLILNDLITAILTTLILIIPIGIFAIWGIFIIALVLDFTLWLLKTIMAIFRI